MEYIIIGLLAVVIALQVVLLVRKQDFDKFERQLKEEGTANRGEASQNARQLREEIQTVLGENQSQTQKQLEGMVDIQLKQLSQVSANNNETIGMLSKNIENRLELMQKDNASKLDQMRNVVDEKLQKTLETRLSESFKTVSERLEQVHKGLGEMQTLAQGVGDLKKVLSNVKTRGMLGELQLGNLLSQILSPAQYDENVATKPGSNDRVEFAVKIPSADDDIVYLPMDAKFPVEDYTRLLDAYDSSDTAAVAAAQKDLTRVIKSCAKDIFDKYVYPPSTTDFAIMFLPVEGLYAEIARNSSLLEEMQRNYRVIIAGPTTASALLTSLQLGFKTMAIEKRSSDVWNILATVKTEFEKFEDTLTKAQSHISMVSRDIDSLVGVRTRQILRKLSGVSEIESDSLESEEE